MLTGDGAFHQCFNAQAVVDADHQVIVATEVNTNAADVGNLIPMTQQTLTNTGQAPGQLLADAGYCSAQPLSLPPRSHEHATEFYIATGRRRRDEPPPVAPRGRIPKSATGKPRMPAWYQERPRGLCPPRGHRRTIFGHMSTLQNAKHLLLRGLDQARGEWLLLAACHNLRKLHGVVGVSGLDTLATI